MQLLAQSARGPGHAVARAYEQARGQITIEGLIPTLMPCLDSSQPLVELIVCAIQSRSSRARCSRLSTNAARLVISTVAANIIPPRAPEAGARGAAGAAECLRSFSRGLERDRRHGQNLRLNQRPGTARLRRFSRWPRHYCRLCYSSTSARLRRACGKRTELANLQTPISRGLATAAVWRVRSEVVPALRRTRTAAHRASRELDVPFVAAGLRRWRLSPT